jgi:hypothetical protein
MTAGWVAAATRGRALLGRTVGPTEAADIVEAPSWNEARRRLTQTTYGSDLTPDADRRDAVHAAHATTVWQLRVLAGWLPPGGSGLARLAVAPFEISNIERHLAGLAGGTATTPFELGSLSVAWPRVATTATSAEARSALAHSAWGDPGGDDRTAVSVGLRVAWARRVLTQAASARPWAMGAMAILVAREHFVFERPITDATARDLDHALGTRWRTAKRIVDLADAVPDAAAWPLRDIDQPEELWRSELEFIRRVGTDAAPVAGCGRHGRATVVAIMALLLVDAWRIGAAIEGAGSGDFGRGAVGSDDTGREVLDAAAP